MRAKALRTLTTAASLSLLSFWRACKTLLFVPYSPQIDRVVPSRGVFDSFRPLRLPIAHIEVVRDDPRTWLHLSLDGGSEPQIDVGQQIHGQNRSAREVHGHDILLANLDELFHPRFLDVFV